MDIKQYPSLQKMEDKMMKFVEYFAKYVMDYQNDGSAILHMDEVCEAYEIEYGEVLDQSLFQKMLSERKEFTEVERDLGKLFIEINNNVEDYEPREIEQKELDIVSAKHVLWQNGLGGRQAVFSNCILRGLDFVGKNLIDCDCENAVFIDCDMRFANINNSWINSAKFINCNMRGISAIKAHFSESKFENCDLSDSSFNNGTLINVAMFDCDTENMDTRHSLQKGFEQIESEESKTDSMMIQM